MTETAVYAAGAVVWRLVEGKLRVLVVHRGKYRDVSLPKGKVDPGEMLAETAVREVEEETGIRVSLGVPVGVSNYRMPNKRQKIVHYWAAEATDDAIRASTFVPNREIAALEWLSVKKARAALSYPVDVEILDEFARLLDDGVLRTFPIIVLRHGKALGRDQWGKPDRLRPLAPKGRKQAEQIVGALSAFGVEKIVTSPATRCAKTVAPLAKRSRLTPSFSKLISQDEWDAGRAGTRPVVGKRIRARAPAVLCSHRPLLPQILAEIALATGTMHGSYLGSASALSPGAFSVVHLSESNPGSGIVSIETHEPPI